MYKTFNNKPEVKKGNVGEDIVTEFLEQKKCIVYTTNTDAPHSFDLMFHTIGIKHKIYFGEVKTKSSMSWNIGNVTGINTKSLDGYVEMIKETGRDLRLFFVDTRLKLCYSVKLSTLSDKWSKEIIDSRTNQKITVWKLSDMTTMFELDEKQINKINKY